MKKLFRLVWICSAVGILVACQPKDKDMEIVSPPPVNQGKTSADTSSSSSAQVGSINGSEMSSSMNDAQEQELTRNEMGVLIDEFGIPKHTVFYFDFDQSSISEGDLDALASHGEYIARSSSARVRIEGHTDERGAREYNVALGENRAKSVERILQLQGVKPEQLSILSFGEEQPADIGHTDNSWALNRRVEIIYEIR